MPGEGSIYRRKDGRYVATISVGPRGKRRVATAYRHSRPEALAALAGLRAGHGRIDRRTTVSGYLERWLADADVKATTRHGYRAVIDTHLAPAIGHVRLAELGPLDVRRMMAGLTGSPSSSTPVARQVIEDVAPPVGPERRRRGGPTRPRRGRCGSPRSRRPRSTGRWLFQRQDRGGLT